MLENYRQHVAERAALGIPPLPLSAKQTEELVALLKNPPAGEEKFLVELITYRVPAGVDDAAKVKAAGGNPSARYHARWLQHQADDRCAR
jgi:aconitate hydratase 2/2-methylisocitrate dehydratase